LYFGVIFKSLLVTKTAMKKILIAFLLLLLSGVLSYGQDSLNLKYLSVPKRNQSAAPGSFFAALITGKNLEDREKDVVNEILAGNIPSFSRKLKPVSFEQSINGENYQVTFFVLCDYMAIGSDDDYLYMPMTPSTAQYLCDVLNCSLPTKKLVDLIYNSADVKLRPQPIPPSDKMTTVPVFKQHTDSIKQQIDSLNFNHSDDLIIAGHKKDVIISNKIYSNDRNYDRVVIYGWHLSEGHPIQPVYNGHIAAYADYSHGIRLISDTVLVNGTPLNLREILKDPVLSNLLSDEGVIAKPYYPPSKIFTSVKNGAHGTGENIYLKPNYPNPFGEKTTNAFAGTVISYSIPFISGKHYKGASEKESDFVSLKVYDVLGREVATLVNGKQMAGNYSVMWKPQNLPGGIYIYRLKTGLFEESGKMVLLR